ncbi:MAG TPA: efflux RND transporter periplasmic adaptor subunit [Pyrinomonadaceae bacterium]|nr:efflux RND transporter periplasmic adaptor subunit [Pyrinomonadaceae bacterium]
MSRTFKAIAALCVPVKPIAFSALMIPLIAGCSRKAAPPGPGAPEVLVTIVQQQDVPGVRERVATLDGFVNAAITARVSGHIISQDYQEGTNVKKGGLLFQIDPRPFEEALAQAKATLAKARATWAKADADEKRANDLSNNKVISPQERDTALQAAAASKADVEADEAAVKQAELNLEYTKVTAPIDGMAGFATKQVGDLVSPTSGPLTTISQIDPIKALVTAGESAFSDFVSKHPDPVERDAFLKKIPFELILSNGKTYPHKGTFFAIDRSLDPRTGSIRYEVTFPNPGESLRPGQFGRVRFVLETKKDALLVPQEAVSELQGSFQVSIVTDDNKVTIRPVKTGERYGTMWEITEGLKPGDRVVVQGGQRTREGSTVKVKEWTAPPPKVASDGSPAPKSP